MLNPRYRRLLARLKLRHLRVVEAIAQSGNVSAAADQLGVTQPAVSKGLREIETILGVKLFERSIHGLTLTPYGRAVLAHGKVIQSELWQITEQVDALNSGISGLVTVGATLVSTSQLLPRALRLLRERTFAAAVRIIDGSEENLVAALEEGVADLVVGRLPSTGRDDDLLREVLLHEPIIVVAGRNHPLARKKDVSYVDLAQAEWIFPPPRSFVHGAIMQIFAQNGLPRPNQYVECLSFLTTRALLVENGMVAALPVSVVEHERKSGLIVELPVRFPQEALPVGVVTRRGKPLSTLANVMIECLREAATATAEAMNPPPKLLPASAAKVRKREKAIPAGRVRLAQR
jgi:DNA-binding transcriptional LysR family regulator